MAVSSQRSFASGEISPSLHSRVDFYKYATGLKQSRNGTILRHGGWANRPGTKFVGEAPHGNVKLLEFVLDSKLSYVIELSDKAIRFIKGDDYIYDYTEELTSWTVLASETRLNYAFGGGQGDKGFKAGDFVYFGGNSTGAEIVKGKTLRVAEVVYDSGADEYAIILEALDGTALQLAEYSGSATGLILKRCYSVVTEYTSEQVPDVQSVQYGEIVTLVHQEYDPKNLTRTSDTSWAFENLSFTPAIQYPSFIAASGGPTGTTSHRYTVTAVKRDTYEESIAAGFMGAIQLGTIGETVVLTNPQVFPVPSGHGIGVGDICKFSTNGFIPGLENAIYTVIAADATSITINFDGTKYEDLGPFTYSQFWKHRGSFVQVTKGNPSGTDPISVSWPSVNDAVEYNVYKESNGVYGLLGITSSTKLLDVGQTVDTTKTPPYGGNPFAAPGDKPGAVTYIQQRLALANMKNDPQKIITSRTGETTNFSRQRPLQDDDSIIFNIAGKQRNEVNHMLDLGKLIILTSAGEWSAEGDAAGILRPTDINLRQHSYNGCNKLPPVIVDGSALYVQGRGSIIRDLGFNYQIDGYQGNDLTIFSSHLFDNFQVVDWAYQQVPNSIVWAVRDDGTLLGLTLVREQQLLAWHRHDFQGGKVKNVASIPGSDQDIVYMTIERVIDGEKRTYLERLTSRGIKDNESFVFMDSSISYDGKNTGDTGIVIYNGPSSDWKAEEIMYLTSTEALFSDDDVGNAFVFYDNDGLPVTLTITAAASNATAWAVTDKDVPPELQGASISDATTNWSYAVDEVAGLTHLEGMEVSVLADGGVVSSPLNPDGDTLTVSGGKVVLPKTFTKITVGLPYVSDLETLNIDTPQGETLSNKKINITQATVFLENTRGGWYGAKAPSDNSNLLENLREAKFEGSIAAGGSAPLKTGKIDINLKSEWNSNGSVFVRQLDPLPLSVLSIFPSGYIPYR